MFYLIINIDFENLDDKDYFINEFKVLQEYCNKNEPFLLQYEFAISDHNNLRIIIIEKYDSKENYVNIHRRSSNFLSFKDKIKHLKISIQGNSYIV